MPDVRVRNDKMIVILASNGRAGEISAVGGASTVKRNRNSKSGIREEFASRP